jgi:hypothetical protein
MKAIGFVSPWLLVAVLWGLVSVLNVSGQGTTSFGNFNAVFDVDGKTLLAGPEFLAELYAAAPGNSLEPISASITPFLVAAAGFFYNAVDVVIPGVPDGSVAVCQVVAWRASDGPTFAAANHPGAHVGASTVFSVVLPDPIGPPGPPHPDNFKSFSLYVVVPEPSVLLLGFLGGVVVILRSRLRGVH